MLQALYVENFALIERLELPFAQGLNALSGETGAGKSLLLDAVSLLIGGRAQEQFIRDGHDRCLVEGRFFGPYPAALAALLAENGLSLEAEDALILSREYQRNGRNICRINGRAVPLGLLRQAGRLLINIHGQMEHMLLLEERQQSALLDRFGGPALEQAKAAVGTAFAQMEQWRQKAVSYESQKQERAQRLDWLQFQLEEIQQAELQPGEEEALNQERNRLLHAETLRETLRAAMADAESAAEAAANALAPLKKGAAIDASLSAVLANAEDIYYNLEELRVSLSAYSDAVESNPYRLEEIEDRLALLRRLTKKYGPSLTDVLTYAKKAQAEYAALLDFDYNGAQAEEEYQQAQGRYMELAKQLSTLRAASAAKLGEAVSGQLQALYMQQARFQVVLEPAPASAEGLEQAVFLIQSNTGEKFLPVSKIASGGELSRVILALKVILAQLDEVPTLVFDEVDSGLGGRALNAVVAKMEQVAQSCQALCVSHAPQMAAHADQHIHIFKQVENGRTIVGAKLLAGEDRLQEIARMIAGDQITAATIAQARDMLQK